LLFRVSEWPSIVESEPNNELQDLPLLNWPVLVSGRLGTARDVDLYRFHARAGQRINLNIFAMRNWSTADLSLALLTPNGRAIKQDEGRFIWDPTVSFVSPKDGDYLAAVMLTRMPAGGQTGTNLVYQLAIGDVPILLSAFPFFWRAGDPISLRVRGEFVPANTNWESEGVELQVEKAGEIDSKDRATELAIIDLAGRALPDASPGIHFLRPRHPSGLVAPVAVEMGDIPTRTEAEKNDDMGTAQTIPIPVVINGRIGSHMDEDVYRLEVEAGDALVFDLEAERWGSKLDGKLSLLDAAGQTVAFNDDSRTQRGLLNWDPRLEHSFKERGTYYIKISSLQRRGGEDYIYALTARRQTPGFSLALGAERIAVRRGGEASWNVTVQREDGFKGEVVIEVCGLPAGLVAKPLQIKPDQGGGKIELTAAANASLQAVGVEMTGKAMVDGKEMTRKATVPAARVNGSGPGFEHYRSTAGWVSIIEPPLFSLESAVSEVFLVRGGQAEFGVKITRRPGPVKDLKFTLENLPQGVALQKVEIIDEGRLARLTLRASETATVGRVPEVTIIGSIDHEGVRRSEPAPRINVQVD
jgi:hypothetical protein